VAESDGSEEEAERSEKEKIYQEMKVLQKKVREMAKQKEDIAATAFKQTDYLWNEIHQRDASNACLKVIAKKCSASAVFSYAAHTTSSIVIIVTAKPCAA
jgi:imidazoleglycerol phosphate synthase glutamine amidotransferase subunit HisH